MTRTENIIVNPSNLEMQSISFRDEGHDLLLNSTEFCLAKLGPLSTVAHDGSIQTVLTNKGGLICMVYGRIGSYWEWLTNMIKPN
jgi:hypothetical protein